MELIVGFNLLSYSHCTSQYIYSLGANLHNYILLLQLMTQLNTVINECVM